MLHFSESMAELFVKLFLHAAINNEHGAGQTADIVLQILGMILTGNWRQPFQSVVHSQPNIPLQPVIYFGQTHCSYKM